MLYSEFSKYGEIVDSIVMKNPETGNSRGFGFVTYKENQSAESAVAAGSHKVDGKIVDVKLCNPRLAAQQRNIKQRADNCKVFVGGLPHGVTDEQIKQFFARYGPVSNLLTVRLWRSCEFSLMFCDFL
jgi:RNA recognition motif-containing protein